MATGTSSGLLDAPKAQSIFKHAILESHIIRFAAMTASRIPDRRAVIVDGFAGRGRYPNGSAASGEHILLAAQKIRATTNVQVFLTEKKKSDFKELEKVANEYLGRGITVAVRQGMIQQHLPEVLHESKGAPLFLFLDPCGANLPFATLADVLGRERSSRWPPTEVLLNFSADLTRRAAGTVKAGLVEHESIPVMNDVCGGEWWQDLALEAREKSPTGDWETAAEAVVNEYARRLGRASNSTAVVVPVRRKASHQPVYHLVFLTRGQHGVWVFGDAAATARLRWLRELGPSGEEADGMLFDVVETQIESEQSTMEEIIKRNILQLVTSNSQLKLVDHPLGVFGSVYGTAQEKIAGKALRQLVKEGAVQVVKPAKHARDRVIASPHRAT
ncbi:three-Cys-motif partner protein TcmP [Actinopolymorpha pittospori]